MLKLNERTVVLAGLTVFAATVLRLEGALQNGVASQAPQATIRSRK